MASINLKVWRDKKEDLWYWKAISEEDGDTQGFLPDLESASTREEVIAAALEAFREDTDSETPDHEIEIKVRGLMDEDDEVDEDWPEEDPVSEEDPDA